MASTSNTTAGDEAKGTYVYEYPRPAVTADNVIFGFDGERLRILLVERGLEPYKGCWALPGGFMRINETIDQCARRELREETNISDVYLEQFHVFSDPGRDPRGRVMTVAYIALVRPSDHAVIGGDDASNAMWFDADMLPPLAFDHLQIVDMARQRLKELLKTRPVAFRLLDEIFTVDELRRVYEVISGNTFDRRNFHRKLMQTGVISDVEESIPGPCPANADVCRSSAMPAPALVYSKSRIEKPSVNADELESRPAKTRSRRLRFFRFNKDRKETSGSEDDASIKDLFNFD